MDKLEEMADGYLVGAYDQQSCAEQKLCKHDVMCAFKAGYSARQGEVDELKLFTKFPSEKQHKYDNLLLNNLLLNNKIFTLTKQLDEVTKVKERYKEALELFASSYFDCLDCEGLIEKGLICEYHLNDKIKIAKQALSSGWE